MLSTATKLSIAAVTISFASSVSANTDPETPGNDITVYSCDKGKLVQSFHQADVAISTSLIRSGQAVWSNGLLDASTIEAIAEGRGIWSVSPMTTLAQLAMVKVPPDILTAIAIKESGRNGRFWPWTINWNGRGFYLESKEKAVEAAKILISNGFNNFDIALMQVNWRWHSHRFKNIESAFDPITNIQVAEQIISEHYKATGSWRSAIARYHSRTESRNQPYLAGVLAHLGKIQQSTKEIPEKKIC
ncbi:MAG: transglycosylase SLT domain-containing protein [Thiothrix litoralis]|uniref:transglycosylase SLT domain-containing protein n=1 Tax=Thiothrix litoralis TaxID=2891210 RepID=UPI003C774A3C